MFEDSTIIRYPIRTCAVNAQPFIDRSMVYLVEDLQPRDDHFVISTDMLRISPPFRNMIDRGYRIVIELNINHLDPNSDFVKQQSEIYFIEHRTGNLVCIPPGVADKIPQVKELQELTLLSKPDYNVLSEMLTNLGENP